MTWHVLYCYTTLSLSIKTLPWRFLGSKTVIKSCVGPCLTYLWWIQIWIVYVLCDLVCGSIGKIFYILPQNKLDTPYWGRIESAFMFRCVNYCDLHWHPESCHKHNVDSYRIWVTAIILSSLETRFLDEHGGMCLQVW